MDARQQELIDFLFPRKQIPATTTTTIGTAMSDSESGKVMVLINSDVLSGDGSTNETSTVEMPTTEYVKSGDQVVVSMFGTDVKTPTVTGVYGGGDSINDRVAALEAGGGAIIIDNDATEIAARQYANRDDIFGAAFPEVVTAGTMAFSNCPNLMSASVPSCENIPQQMFSSCYSLTDIVSGAETIGTYAFYNSGLRSPSFPNVITVNDFAFEQCSSMIDISLPSATTIKGGAFRDCTLLRRLSLPSATTFPGAEPIVRGCTSLERIDLPKSNVCPPLGRDLSSLLVLNFCDITRSVVPDYDQSIAYTPIDAGIGFIYINDALVTAMQAATGWSTYASQIRPWSELRC